VTIGKDGFGFRSECAIHLDSGIVLQAEAMAADAYASADQAAERIEKRLRRYKRRLRDHAGRSRNAGEVDGTPVEAASYAIVATPDHEDDAELAGFAPVIIAESTTELPRLSVSEAVQDLDMSGARVIIFRHAGHGRLNVVYRRADGHIGWVDPPHSGRDGGG
jgi:hypothetical protein